MQPFSGHIELILGPMFAGKTTELHQRVKRYHHACHRCIVVKFAGDSRYTTDASTCTHDGTTLQDQKGGIRTVAASTLAEVTHALAPYSVVAVDEGQFFPDIAEAAEALANEGKIVIVSALDGAFDRKPFSCIMNLIPLAENVDKMTAVCKLCFRTAHFSKRTTSDTCVQLIGGKDMYIPVCRACYHKPTPLRSEAEDAGACTGTSRASCPPPAAPSVSCLKKEDAGDGTGALCSFVRSRDFQALMQQLIRSACASSHSTRPQDV